MVMIFHKSEFSVAIFSNMASVFGKLFAKSRAHFHADHAENKISAHFFDFAQLSPFTKLVTFLAEISSCIDPRNPKFCKTISFFIPNMINK